MFSLNESAVVDSDILLDLVGLTLLYDEDKLAVLVVIETIWGPKFGRKTSVPVEGEFRWPVERQKRFIGYGMLKYVFPLKCIIGRASAKIVDESNKDIVPLTKIKSTNELKYDPIFIENPCIISIKPANVIGTMK